MPPPPPKLSPTRRLQLFFRRRCRRLRRRLDTVCDFVQRSVSLFPFLKKKQSVPADVTRCLEGEIIGSYKIISEINKGTFGAVYRCQHTETGKQFAAKYYSLDWIRSEDGMCMTGTEMHVMKLLNHPNTVSLEEILFIKDGLLLIMELVQGRNLLEILPSKRGVMEPFARQIFTQFLDGLEYLHQHRIVHRDIKLENVMIDHDGNVKIIDYGLAEYVPRKRWKNGALVVNMECGSLNYLAPEIIVSQGQYYRGDLTDFWASGILLYVLVTGYFPFDHDNDAKLREIIHGSDDYVEDALDDSENMSRELKDFLRKILVKRPNQRPSIADMKAHPWMKGTKLETERYPVKTFTNKSGNFSVTFHDERPDCSLTSAKHFPGKDGASNRRLFFGRHSHSIPPGYKHGVEYQSHTDSESSSRATTESRKPHNRDLSKLLAKVFKSSKRMTASPILKNETEKTQLGAES